MEHRHSDPAGLALKSWCTLPQFVDAHGWKMLAQTSYSKMADDAGLHPDLRAADIAAGSPADRQAAFFVAVRQ